MKIFDIFLLSQKCYNIRMKQSIILLAIVTICEFILLKTFLYQRTVRRLGIYFGLTIQERNVFYPAITLFLFRMSYVRWAALLILFFTDRKCAFIAVAIMGLFFCLSTIMPVNERLNLLKIRNVIVRKKSFFPAELYDRLIKEIDKIITAFYICETNDVSPSESDDSPPTNNS